MTAAPLRLTDMPPAGLVRMRWLATGLLLAMAAMFLAARALAPDHAWAGFVRAFAEAAMVGGLADWFAVTALFRHPLGVPIPHTAIIPRNKDRIGTTLAAFLRDNFLIPSVVARRMRRADVAGAAGRWLSSPHEANVRLKHGLSRLATRILETLDQRRLGGMVKTGIGAQLRKLDVAPLVGQALGAAIAERRHLPLLDGIIRWAAKVLTANERLVREMVHQRAGALLRLTGLDSAVANKVISGLEKLIDEMAADPDHPLRAKAEEGLATLAHDLQHSPEMQARVQAVKAEIIDNPAMQRWLDGLWEHARAWLLVKAADPDAILNGQVGDALRQLGEALVGDAALRATVNRFLRRGVVGLASDYGDAIVRLVSETVEGWDARTITTRLENAVGRDLQYIRINGTVVGGLVGLAIHAVDVML